MKLFALAPLCLILLCGCSTIHQREQEKPAAFASLSESERHLVSHGQIEKGMDTNAVYIAWGKPSATTTQPAPNGSGVDQTWAYYGNRPVLTPAWMYLPSPNGYWTLEYVPEHHSVPYTKAEVFFRNGVVVDWKKY